MSCLLQAAMNGHDHCIISLSRFRAEIEAKDLEKERTSLHYVCEPFDTFGLIEQLKSVLFQAAIHGKDKCISALLKHKADVDVKDKDGKTALELAINEECRKLLEQVLLVSLET